MTTAVLLFIRGVWKAVPWQVWAVLAAVLAFFIWGRLQHHNGVNEGKTEVEQELKDETLKLEDRANAASNRVARCYASGGSWDTSHGVCNH